MVIEDSIYVQCKKRKKIAEHLKPIDEIHVQFVGEDRGKDLAIMSQEYYLSLIAMIKQCTKEKKSRMDFEKYAKETLETYQGELKKVQESINLHVGELDMLKKSEQRLMGAIASINDLLQKEKKKKKRKKRKLKRLNFFKMCIKRMLVGNQPYLPLYNANTIWLATINRREVNIPRRKNGTK